MLQPRRPAPWATRLPPLPSRRGRGSRALGGALLLCGLAACLWRGDDDNESGAGQVAFVSHGFVKQAGPPGGSFLVGTGLYFLGGGSKTCDTAATVMIYFGAQTGMNLYMKSVLSNIVISEEERLRGIPIGFLLTCIQQFVAFATFSLYLLVRQLVGRPYQVKLLRTKRDFIAVLSFSICFALNIGLNNFGLSLVAISINMIIRSCLPLSTALSQMLLGWALGLKKGHVTLYEWALMLVGVACAAVATYAKSASGGNGEESAGLVLGVIVCVASIFSGALNMVLAGVLGSELKLNPVDTTAYMALPAGVVLLLPSLLVSHPVGKWPGFGDLTDWQVLQEVVQRNPSALGFVAFSGVLAFLYNILQYSLVHKLSASYAAFAGNFNKAATVALSLAIGLEALPSGGYGALFLLAVMGNIVAFTLYSAHKASVKG